MVNNSTNINKTNNHLSTQSVGNDMGWDRNKMWRN